MTNSRQAGGAESGPDSEAKLPIGEQVGEYEITGELGAGGFGTVYAAVHPLIGKKAAVKVLNREFSANPDMVSRFQAEARAANTIRHANIIDVFNFGTLEDGRRYFVMELLDGASFDDYLREHAPLEPALVLAIMRGVAGALDAAHAAGIVHRDLKPDNIFLSFDDDGRPRPKLLDFGVAKLLGDAKSISGHKTQTGAPVGTPSYMSPEQCLGESVDHAADIYAFGLVCFEALTGSPPFSGSSFLQLMNQQTSAERPAASQLNPALPSVFDEPLKRIMAIDKRERPDSVGAAYDVLLAAARSAGINDSASAPAPSIKLRSSNTDSSDTVAQAAATVAADTLSSSTMARRTPNRTGLVIALSAILVGGGVYLALVDRDAPTQPVTPAATPSASDADAVTSGESTTQQDDASTRAATTASDASSTSAAPPTFRVRVVPKLPAAQVYLDGHKLGPPPGPFDLPTAAGDHTLLVKAPGYRPAVLEGPITADSELELRLHPAPRIDPDLENPF